MSEIEYTTNYNLVKYAAGYQGWAEGVNDNFDTIDSTLKSLADDISVLEAGSPVPRNLEYEVPGDDDVGTHVHFHVQVSDERDFSDILVEKESKDNQANWYYDNGSGAFVAVPEAGILAYWEWEQDAYGQWEQVAKENTNTVVFYRIPETVTSLSIGTVYYWRMRQYDVEGDEYGGWQCHSSRA